MRVTVLLGTNKGAFFLESDEARENWRVEGPFCEAWPINHVTSDGNGRIYAAGGNEWLGLDVWRTEDHGGSWARSGEGISLGDEKIDAVWSLACSGDAVYAGVKPAAIFRSADGGETWAHLEGLANHPTRKDWVPGGAGLTLHHIVAHPEAPQKLWVGISVACV
ncbi:MAG: exo-alpha-sialidase, partial [Pseudomonadota bacterium]